MNIAWSPETRWIWSADARHAFNNVVYFRKTIALSGAAVSACLNISADTRYKLFLNGTWAHGRVPTPHGDINCRRHDGIRQRTFASNAGKQGNAR